MKRIARRTRSLGLGLLDGLGLAVLLAIADAWLHGRPGEWIGDPGGAGRALTWLALAYGAIVLAAAAVFRNRARVAAAVAAGFVIGQGGFWLFRSSARQGAVTEAAPWVLGGLLLGAAGLAWLAGYAVKRSEFPERAARVLVAGAAVVAVVSLLAPRPQASLALPPPWPPPETPRAAPEARPNVLLVTLDTVRPDHLGAYGYAGIETPHLDGLARDGVLFGSAVAQAPVTPPSHASLLTGLYPVRHGVRDFETSLGPGPEVVSLAEILRDAGYATGAIIAAAPLAPEYGLGRGFDVYHYVEFPERYVFQTVRWAMLPWLFYNLGLVRDGSAYRRGPEITEDALRWIERYGEGPFFLWVHYFDAHAPYWPDAVHRRAEFHPGTRFLDRFGPIFAYDSEIVGVDTELGRLLEALGVRGLLERTIVVVASDHGQGLGDHSYFGHTRRVYQEQLRIVLIFRYPARIPPGVRVDSQVRSIDVVPTVLELLDLPVPAGLDGESLLPLLTAGAAAVDRTSFAELLRHMGRPMHFVAVSDGRHKLIESRDGRRWLFDLQQDPGEERNLADSLPSVRARLEARVREYLERSAPREESPVPSWHLDDSLRQRLRALGYLE